MHTPHTANAINAPLIAVVLAQLRGAGIQKMRLQLSLELAKRGYNVEIVTGQNRGELSKKIPKGIPVTELSRKSKLLFFPRIVRYIKERRPTAVLSSYEDLSAMLILAKKLTRSDTTILTSFHNAPHKVTKEGGTLRRALSSLAYKIISSDLHKDGKIVAVSNGVGVDLATTANIDPRRIKTIYNPVIKTLPVKDTTGGDNDQKAGTKKKTIGYFGRLHRQKRVDILIRAFKEISTNESYHLLVVGDGELRSQLEKLSRSLEIQHRVTFEGFSDKPHDLMKSCSVVVLPSDYEGFGNVIVEAMWCGTQVISTNCPHGPAEILANGEYGQLIPVGDARELAKAMEDSLEGRFWVEPKNLIERARDFSVSRATDAYLDTLGLPRHWHTEKPRGGGKASL